MQCKKDSVCSLYLPEDVVQVADTVCVELEETCGPSQGATG